MPFDNCFEICVQNGSILCIWSRASCPSAVKGIIVISWVISTMVKSDVAGFMMDGVFEGHMSLVVWHCSDVWLLLNAGPSSLGLWASWLCLCYCLVIWLIWRGNQQLCFLLLISIQTWYCRLQVPIPVCWLCYWYSFHLGIWLMVCGFLWTMISDPWR